MIRYIQFEVEELHKNTILRNHDEQDTLIFNKEEVIGNDISSRLTSYDHIISPVIDLKLVINTLHKLFVDMYNRAASVLWYMNTHRQQLASAVGGKGNNVTLNVSGPMSNLLTMLRELTLFSKPKLYKMFIKYLKRTRRCSEVDVHKLILTLGERHTVSDFIKALTNLNIIFRNFIICYNLEYKYYSSDFRVQIKPLAKSIEVGKRAIADVIQMLVGNFKYATMWRRDSGSSRVVVHRDQVGLTNPDYLMCYSVKMRCYTHIERNKIREELYNAAGTIDF